jgi:hypothetical protein
MAAGISWSPKAPFDVAPGSSRTVTVSVDYRHFPSGDSQALLLVYSNDPLENPNPGEVDVSITADTFIDPDTFESNDSFENASDLGTLGDRNEDGLNIHVPGNDDYYRLRAAATGTLDVDLLFSHGSGDINLCLYDATSLLDCSESTSSNESVSVAVVGGESYFIQVFGNAGATQPNYSLRIDGPGGGPDRLEPDDSFGAATDLGALGDRYEGDLTIHAQNNDDHFTLTAASAGTLNVEALFSHGLGDIDLCVYDATSLLACSLSITDDESVSIQVVGGETYFVRVYGHAGATHSSYGLWIEGPGGPCPPDTDGDFVCDSVDNCPEIHNPGQQDLCDPDILCDSANCDQSGFSADRMDGRDLGVLAGAWGTCPGEPRYDACANLDRVPDEPGSCIGPLDFHSFMSVFGKTCPGAP